MRSTANSTPLRRLSAVLLALALAVALTLGVAACSSQSDDEAGADATPTPAATSAQSDPTPAETAEESAGGDLAEQQAKLEDMVAQSQSSIPALYDAFPGMYSEIAISSEEVTFAPSKTLIRAPDLSVPLVEMAESPVLAMVP